MLQEVTTIVNYVLAHKDAILAIVGGGAGLSVFSQVILHKINVKWSINNKPFSYTLVQVLTVIATVAAYLADNASVGTVYPWLALTAATIHRYAVSPYYTKKVLPYLTFLTESSAQPSTAYEAPAPHLGEPAPAFLN